MKPYFDREKMIDRLEKLEESSDSSSTELESDNVLEIFSEPVGPLLSDADDEMTETYDYESVLKDMKDHKTASEHVPTRESPASVVTPPCLQHLRRKLQKRFVDQKEFVSLQNSSQTY
jgi:hypothetical protein